MSESPLPIMSLKLGQMKLGISYINTEREEFLQVMGECLGKPFSIGP